MCGSTDEAADSTQAKRTAPGKTTVTESPPPPPPVQGDADAPEPTPLVPAARANPKMTANRSSTRKSIRHSRRDLARGETPRGDGEYWYSYYYTDGEGHEVK
jgi:hypothetical protein